MQDASFAMDLGYDIIGVILDEKVPRHGTLELLEDIKNIGATTAAVYTSMESIEQDHSSADYIQIHFNHSTEQIEKIKLETGKKIISVVQHVRYTESESRKGLHRHKLWIRIGLHFLT